MSECLTIASGAKEYQREWRKKHPDYNKKWIQEHREQYTVCRRNWKQEHPEHFREYNRKYRQEHKSQYIQYTRKSHQKLRTQVLEKYGSKCVRCGFSDVRALQIDHVNGGGIKELRGMTQHQYFKKVLADIEGKYQILCANCNWIKVDENNENHRFLLRGSKKHEIKH